jgi:hypothetical protein
MKWGVVLGWNVADLRGNEGADYVAGVVEFFGRGGFGGFFDPILCGGLVAWGGCGFLIWGWLGGIQTLCMSLSWERSEEQHW